MEIQVSNIGYIAKMIAEPTGVGDQHHLVAYIAWKGDMAIDGPTDYVISVNIGMGESIPRRVARVAALFVMSPVLVALVVRNFVNRWRMRLLIRWRNHFRTWPRWPDIQYESGVIRVGEQEFVASPDRTLLLIVDEHDTKTGEVKRLTNHSLYLAPCPIDEDGPWKDALRAHPAHREFAAGVAKVALTR
jgi:hypothetical protein